MSATTTAGCGSASAIPASRNWSQYVLGDFAKAERPWVEALCDIIADNAGLIAKGDDASFQNKVHLAMQAKGFCAEPPKRGSWHENAKARQCLQVAASPIIVRFRRLPPPSVAVTRSHHGFQMRHRRPAERRQIDALQCPDRDRRRGGELSVLHHRAQCRRGRGARSAPRCAGEAREIRADRADAASFVDIAGLVRGASKGEGLGNQFLATIREVDAIAHVVRCFENADVTHVEGRIDPIADIETVETELMLADLDSLERRLDALEKKAKGGDKEAKLTLDLIHRALALLREGKPARLVE